MMRRCSKCEVEQPISNFGVHRQRKDGIALWCKACNRVSVAKLRSTQEGRAAHSARENARYHANPEKIRIRSKAYYTTNIVKARATNAAARLRRMQNPEYRKRENLRISKWGKANKSRVSARARTNRLKRMRAQPMWLTAIQRAQIQEFYEIASAREMQTGEKHHVDHMFAIHGKGLSGLHVPWNLQVLTALENDTKGRNVPPEFKHMLWDAA